MNSTRFSTAHDALGVLPAFLARTRSIPRRPQLRARRARKTRIADSFLTELVVIQLYIRLRSMEITVDPIAF
jgi:hypothetical protein